MTLSIISTLKALHTFDFQTVFIRPRKILPDGSKMASCHGIIENPCDIYMKHVLITELHLWQNPAYKVYQILFCLR